jgi:hypothetical protein
VQSFKNGPISWNVQYSSVPPYSKFKMHTVDSLKLYSVYWLNSIARTQTIQEH